MIEGQVALLLLPQNQTRICTLLSLLGRPEKILFNGVEFINKNNEQIWEIEVQDHAIFKLWPGQEFKHFPVVARKLLPITPEGRGQMNDEMFRLNPQIDLWFGRGH